MNTSDTWIYVVTIITTSIKHSPEIVSVSKSPVIWSVQDMCVALQLDICVDMHAGMHAPVSRDAHVDIYVGMRLHMCSDMRTDMCFGLCTHIRRNTHAGMHADRERLKFCERCKA